MLNVCITIGFGKTGEMKKVQAQAKGLESNSSSDITHQLKITELSNRGHLTTHTNTHAARVTNKDKYRRKNNTTMLQAGNQIVKRPQQQPAKAEVSVERN